MMENSELVIFDLDDTLIDTSDVYYRARKNFIQILEEEGVDKREALSVFETIDGEQIKKLGFVPDRYGKSMLLAYEDIADKHGIDKSIETVEKIKNCGHVIFNEYPRLIEGSLDLLDWAAKNYTLALMTRGIPELQLSKVRAVGIEAYFKKIDVVESKNAATVRLMLEKLGVHPTLTWVVGDSIKSDINPGVEVGAKCILYLYTHHSYRWEQEYTGEKAIGAFYRVEQLADVRQIIEAPEKFAQTTCILPDIR